MTAFIQTGWRVIYPVSLLISSQYSPTGSTIVFRFMVSGVYRSIVATIDTMLGLGLGLGLGFPYIQTGDVCTYPHYLQATSDLYPIKS